MKYAGLILFSALLCFVIVQASEESVQSDVIGSEGLITVRSPKLKLNKATKEEKETEFDDEKLETTTVKHAKKSEKKVDLDLTDSEEKITLPSDLKTNADLDIVEPVVEENKPKLKKKTSVKPKKPELDLVDSEVEKVKPKAVTSEPDLDIVDESSDIKQEIKKSENSEENIEDKPEVTKKINKISVRSKSTTTTTEESTTVASEEEEESESETTTMKSHENKKPKKDEEEVVDEEKPKKEEKREVKEEVAQKVEITPCETSPEFKYFQPHPTDADKFYVCDPWSSGVLDSCPKGLLWNNWLLKCDKAEDIKNLTISFPSIVSNNNTEPIVMNCSAKEFPCQNEGVCIETDGFFKCVCPKDFTGEFCDTKIDMNDLTHAILNGTFSVADYKLALIQENITLEIDFYKRYQDQLDEKSYSELIKYLSMYKKGEIRYDTFINRLVEDILHDIYPDAEYLATFNASQQYVVSMVRLMPSLLSYSKYSFQRYSKVFTQYVTVLNKLVMILNDTVPTIVTEATEYSLLTEVFLNQTVALINKTQDSKLLTENNSKSNIQLNEKDMILNLQKNFNATLLATEALFLKVEKFQETIMSMLEKDKSIYVLTLADSKIEGTQDVINLFNQISESSAQIWDSLINYGFWFITNDFSVTSKRSTANRLQVSLP